MDSTTSDSLAGQVKEVMRVLAPSVDGIGVYLFDQDQHQLYRSYTQCGEHPEEAQENRDSRGSQSTFKSGKESNDSFHTHFTLQSTHSNSRKSRITR